MLGLRSGSGGDYAEHERSQVELVTVERSTIKRSFPAITLRLQSFRDPLHNRTNFARCRRPVIRANEVSSCVPRGQCRSDVYEVESSQRAFLAWFSDRDPSRSTVLPIVFGLVPSFHAKSRNS